MALDRAAGTQAATGIEPVTGCFRGRRQCAEQFRILFDGVDFIEPRP
jgi:hypothetical protein